MPHRNADTPYLFCHHMQYKKDPELAFCDPCVPPLGDTWIEEGAYLLWGTPGLRRGRTSSGGHLD